MSNMVDQRVVEMRFDNKHFESNVQTSMSTLDKLKKSLNLSGAAKGLENINTSSKKVNLTPLSNAVDSVGIKFNGLYSIADQALRNITTRAQMCAERMVKAFTIDPVKTGFSEYELKMGSVQTIMASTGESLDVVNKHLDELNHYSDQTIYSFSDMTSNIGKFTNAGVKLDDAVLAIKGISNAAALSGANANEASRAMYNFAQALSAGHVKLIDWKSIELANMATVEFKQQLIDTAVSLGVVTKEANGMYKTLDGNLFNATTNFNDVLKDEWMTSEVLITTLKNYANETTDIGQRATKAATEVKTFSQMMDTLKESAQSGWAQSMEIIFGDFEEGKNLWTSINNVLGKLIDESSKRRNELLSGALDSPWEQLTKTITDAGGTMEGLEDQLRKTAKEHGIDLDELIKKHKTLENVFKNEKDLSYLLQESLNNMDFSGLDKVTAGMQFRDEGEGVEQLETFLKKLGYGDMLIGKFADKGVDFSGDGFYGELTVEAIKKFQKDSGLKVTGIVDEETLAALKQAAIETDNLKQKVAGLNRIIARIAGPGGRDLLIDSFKNIWDTLSKIFGSIKSAFSEVFGVFDSEGLYGIIEGFHKLTEIFKLNDDQAASLKAALKGVFSVFGIGWDFVKTLGTGLMNLVKGIFPSVGGGFLEIAGKIGEWLSKLRGSIQQSQLFTKATVAITNFIKKAADTIGKYFKMVKDFFTSQQFKDWSNNVGQKLKDFGASAKDHLTKAGKSFSDFFARIKKGDFSVIGEAFTKLKDIIVNFFSGAGSKASDLFGKFLDTVKNFWAKIQEYFTGLGADLGAIGESIGKFFSGLWENLKANAGGIAALGVLGLLFTGIWKIVSLVKHIFKPMDAVGDFIESLTGVSKALGTSIKAESMKVMAESIAIIAGVVAALAFIPADKLWPAIGAVAVLAGIMTAMVTIMTKFGNVGDFAKLAGAVISLSGALTLFAIAAKMIGSIDETSLKKTGAVLGGFILAILALAAISKKFGSVQIAGVGGAILGMSASLLLIAAAVAIFGHMETGTLVKGGAAVAILMGVMVGVIAALGKVTAGLGKKNSIIKVGGTLFAICGSLLLAAAAIAILGNMDIGTIMKGLSIIAVLIVGMIGAIAALNKLNSTSLNFTGVGATMAGMALAILSMSLSLALLSFIKPEDLAKAVIALSAVMLVFGVMTKLTSGMATSKMTKAGSTTKTVGTIVALAAAIGVMAVSLAALSFIRTDKLYSAVGALTIVMAALAGVIASTSLLPAKGMGSLVIITVLVGLIGGILITLAALGDTGADVSGIALSMAAIMVAISAVAAVCTLLGNLPIMAIVKGGVAFAAISAVVAGIVTGFVKLAGWLSADLPDIGTNLAAFANNMTPFLDAMSTIKDKGLAEGMGALADMILNLTSANLNDMLASWFGQKSALENFGEQIVPFGKKIAEFANELKDVDIDTDSFTALITGVKSLAEIANMVPKDVFIDTPFFSYKSVNNLTSFGNFVKAVAPELAKIAIDLNSAKIDRSVYKRVGELFEAVKYLAEAADIVKTNDIEGQLGLFVIGSFKSTEKLNFKEFGEFISTVANAMKDVVTDLNSVVGLDTVEYKGVKTLCESVKVLGEAADLIKTNDVEAQLGLFIVGSFTSHQNLNFKAFGEFVSTVANAMKTVVTDLNSVVGLDTVDYKGVKTLCESVKALAEAAEMVKTTDESGQLGLFVVGSFSSYENLDFDSFGKFVSTVATAMKTVVTDLNSVVGLDKVDYDGVKTLCQGVETLAKAADLIKTNDVEGQLGLFVVGSFSSHESLDFKSFGDFVSTVTTALIPVITQLNSVEGIGTVDYKGVKTLCEGVEALGKAADLIKTSDVEAQLGLFIVGSFTSHENLNFESFGNFVSTVTAALIPVVTQLNSVDGIGKVDYDGVKALCEGVESLGKAADLIKTSKVEGQLLAYLGGSFTSTENLNFESFGNFVFTMANAMKDVVIELNSVDGIGEVDYNGVKTLCDGVKTLGDAASLVKTETNSKNIALLYEEYNSTNVNLDSFGTYVTTVATALSDFITTVMGKISIDDLPAVTESVNNLFTGLSALADAAPVSVLEKTSDWLGSSEKVYSADFDAVSSAFTKIFDGVSTVIDALKFEGVMDASQLMYVVDSLTIIIGVINDFIIQWKGKEEEIDKIIGDGYEGSPIKSLIDYYMTIMETLSTEAVDNIPDLSALSTLASSLQSFADAAYILSSDKINNFNNEKVSSVFACITDAVKTFNTTIGSISENAVSAGDIAGDMAALIYTFANCNLSSINPEQLDETFGIIGQAIKDFNDDMAGVNVSEAVTQVSGIVKAITTVSTASYTGVDSLQTALTTLSTTSIDEFVTAFTTGSEDRVKGAAGTMLGNFATGIEESTETVTGAISTMVDAAAGAADVGESDKTSGFYAAGMNAGLGFANGIKGSTFAVKVAAIAMANAAEAAAMAALDEHSPSKVFYGIGAFAGEGFVNAFADYESKSYRAGGDMADAARLGLSNAISKVQELVSNGIDDQPTIRPVLDLSDVVAGTNRMNNMFGINPSIGVLANVGALNHRINNRQNGMDSDIVSAIEKLGSKLGTPSGDTYSINGVTYDDGSNINDAVKTLVRAARIERRR